MEDVLKHVFGGKRNKGSSYWLRGKNKHGIYVNPYEDDEFYHDEFAWQKEFRDMHKERRNSYSAWGTNVFELARLRSAVANFVRIFTGKNIPVEYATEKGSNYTDGKTVTISSRIEEGDLDVNVGIALHEASHIVWTDFDILNTVYNAPRGSSEVNIEDRIASVSKYLPNTSAHLSSSLLSLVFLRSVAVSFKNLNINAFEDVAREIVNHQKNASATPKFLKRLYRDWAANAVKLEKTIKSGTSQQLSENAFDMSISMHDDFGMMFGITNLLEDIRIDALAKRAAPGYVVYYDALEEHIYNDEKLNEIPDIIRKKIAEDPNRVTVGDYLRCLCTLVTKLPTASTDVLPRLDDAYALIEAADVPNMKSSEDVFILADEVLSIICEGIESLIDDTLPPPPLGGEGADEDTFSGMFSMDGDAIERLNRFLTNSITIQSDADLVSKEDAGKIDAAATTSVRRVQLSNEDLEKFHLTQTEKQEIDLTNGDVIPPQRYACEVIENITNRFIQSGAGTVYGLVMEPTTAYDSYIRDGIRDGRKLAKSLVIRNEAFATVVPNLKNGRLDKRRLAGAGYDNPYLFYSKTESKYQDAVVHISIDVSASMNNERIRQAIRSCVTLAHGLSALNGVKLQISIRGTANSKEAQAFIAVIFDSNRDSLDDLEYRLRCITAFSSTPEGLCYPAIQDVLSKSPQQLKYFITITDGEPCSHIQSMVDASKRLNFHGATALQYGRYIMTKMKRDGIIPVGYFVDMHSTSDESRRILEQAFYDTHFIDTNGFRTLVKDVNAMLRKGGWC